MRKTITALLILLILSCSFVFAEEAAQKSVFESVNFGAGYDLMTANGKFDEESTSFKNKDMGFGGQISTTLDLSAVPNFLKEGWNAYIGLDFFFGKNVTFRDVNYPTETTGVKSNLGIKAHFILMHHFTFETPIDFYMGMGICRDMMIAKLNGDTNTLVTVTGWGFSLYFEGSYKFADHFAVFVSAIPDFTVLTKMQSSEKEKSGLKTVKTRSGIGFGFSISAKLGFKYII